MNKPTIDLNQMKKKLGKGISRIENPGTNGFYVRSYIGAATVGAKFFSYGKYGGRKGVALSAAELYRNELFKLVALARAKKITTAKLAALVRKLRSKH